MARPPDEVDFGEANDRSAERPVVRDTGVGGSDADRQRGSQVGTLSVGHVQFRVFGPIEVRTATHQFGATDFPSRKARQACQILAGAAGRSLSKDQLIDALWGDALPKNPSGALDHTISLLRSMFATEGGAQPIVTERGRYRIDLSIADIDIVRFDSFVDLAAGQPRETTLPFLLDALRLARGPVLEDEPYAPWAQEIRERYRHRVERVLLDVARAALAEDDVETALATAERARTESDLVLEEGYALNIAALIRMGRRHDAHVLMLELERRMLEDFDAEVSPESAMLRTMLRSSSTPTPPGSVKVLARPTEGTDALPFVGRDLEMAIIDEAIDRARSGATEFLVVVGEPGMGKSSLLAAASSVPCRTVRSFACLPSDSMHPLFVVHRLMRSLAREAGLERVARSGETVPEAFARLADMFDELGPTTIAIDDIQWCDESSFAVLAGLVRPHEVDSVAIIAARRPLHGEIQPVGLARLRTVELGPLPRSLVDTFPIVNAWEETGGHPGLLSACLDAQRIDGRLSLTAVADVLDWIGPPASLARVALGVAAALDDTFGIATLARELGLSRATTIELVRDLEHRHLVRQLASGDEYEFTAQLTRRILRETLPQRHRH